MSNISYLTNSQNWNPIKGCKKHSSACKYCWAEAMHKRFHPKQNFNKIQLLRDKLTDPLRWKTPQLVTTCFTSDLFQDDVPDDFIERMISTIFLTRFLHTYVMLTKRPERACSLLKTIRKAECILGDSVSNIRVYDAKDFLNNVWLGTTIEYQDYVGRADHLKAVSIHGHKWLSLEPLLGPINPEICEGFNWVVVGGESGAKARYMETKWVRPIRDYCLEQKIPFYFKQWGKQKKGHFLDGRTHRDVPFAVQNLPTTLNLF